MIRRAGAFTKLIEIPAARAVAKGVMVPARNFMDGANGGELVLDRSDLASRAIELAAAVAAMGECPDDLEVVGDCEVEGELEGEGEGEEGDDADGEDEMDVDMDGGHVEKIEDEMMQDGDA